MKVARINTGKDKWIIYDVSSEWNEFVEAIRTISDKEGATEIILEDMPEEDYNKLPLINE